MGFQRNVPHAMNGSLADIHAAELVLNIYESGLSGRLRFTQNKIRRDIYFRKGDIIFAHSSLPQERFGEILTRLGKIGADEFNAVVREVAEGKRLGETLVERGYISTMDLYVGLNYQVQHILYSVFDWDFGLYEFEEEIRNVQQEIAVRVSTPDLVVRGVRNITNLTVLDRAVGDESRVPLPQGTPRLRRTDFDYQEETILSCVDGKADIQQIRSLSKLTPLEFGRAMFSLLLCGIIGFYEEERPKPSEDPRNWTLNLFEPETEITPTPTVIPASIEIPTRTQERRAIDTFSDAELRDLVIYTSEKFQTATDEEVLNLAAAFTQEDIQSSYDYLTAIFHHCYYSSDQFQDLKAVLKSIVDRLAQAHRNLIKVEHQVEIPPEILAASEVETDIINLEDDTVAAAETEEDTVAAEAEDDTVAAASDDDTQVPEPETENEITAVSNPFPEKIEINDYPMSFELPPPQSVEPAEPPLQAETKEPERIAVTPETVYSTKPVLDFPIQISPMPEPTPAAKPKPAKVQTPAASGGDLSLKELERLVSNNPSDVAFLRSFGKRLQEAGRPLEGEKQLLRALSIEPRNLENHFALADFYQVQGLKLKARNHLNIILQLDPDNEKALAVLGVTKRKSMLFQVGVKNHQDAKNRF
jgi:tetratricopeptide (TPR) repeat protein